MYKAEFEKNETLYTVNAETPEKLKKAIKDLKKELNKKTPDEEVREVANALKKAKCPICGGELELSSGGYGYFFKHVDKEKQKNCKTFSIEQLDREIHSIDDQCSMCKKEGYDTGLTFRRAGGVFPYNSKKLGKNAKKEGYTISVADIYDKEWEEGTSHYWGCKDYKSGRNTGHTYKKWADKSDIKFG